MKFLLVFASVSLFSYAIALPIKQNVALHRANAALRAGNLESAMAYVNSARHEWPQFYAARASAVCGDITLAQARRMTDSADPDFGGAASLLRDLTPRCGTSGREGEAARLLDRVSALHLAQAVTRCQRQDYAGALTDWQQILTLPYPAHSLGQAQGEAAWCRLELANALAKQQLFEAALQELYRLISTTPGPAREVALKQVPALVEDELHYWRDRKQYHQAFKQLGQRQQRFGEYPETASFFAGIGSQVEYQVFGVVLSQQCREAASPRRESGKPVRKKPQERPQGAVMVTTAVGAVPSGGSPTANLVMHNDTKHRLRVLLRGQEQRDVLLEPQATQELQLEPAEYLVGIYSPGNCQVKPERTTWTIRSWGPHSVRFYEGKV